MLDRSTKVPHTGATKTVPEMASAPESAAPKCSQVGRSEGGLNFSLLANVPLPRVGTYCAQTPLEAGRLDFPRLEGNLELAFTVFVKEKKKCFVEKR